MKKYQCHKIVSAFKIDGFVRDEHGDEVALQYDKLVHYFGQDYMTKHNPQLGGYYVLYDDGYESFSPAETFETGYTLLENEPQ